MPRYEVADEGVGLVGDDLEVTLEWLEDSLAVKSYGDETFDVAVRDDNLDDIFEDDGGTAFFFVIFLVPR